MEPEVVEAEIVLPTRMKFKKIQMADKYPKGQARGRHWKHLKQIIQAENFQNYAPNEPTCEFHYHGCNFLLILKAKVFIFMFFFKKKIMFLIQYRFMCLLVLS